MSAPGNGGRGDRIRVSGRLRRLGCMGFVLFWLCVAVLSSGIGLLAVQEEIVLSPGTLRESRFWLVNEAGSRGLGFSSARISSGSEESGQACVETRVRYLLWQSDESQQQSQYCECYARNGDAWDYLATCSP